MHLSILLALCVRTLPAEGSSEFEVHAAKAQETGALSTLCQLTSHVGLQPYTAEMYNNIVLRCLAGPPACLHACWGQPRLHSTSLCLMGTASSPLDSWLPAVDSLDSMLPGKDSLSICRV